MNRGEQWDTLYDLFKPRYREWIIERILGVTTMKWYMWKEIRVLAIGDAWKEHLMENYIKTSYQGKILEQIKSQFKYG